ncbi:MAG: 3-phosphoshikimate 1-carboxyvinyltransferase [Planctomycetota bacterium]
MQVGVRAGRIAGRILVPGSKSIAQRALILATRRGGRVTNVPESGDLTVLCEGLRALGYRVDEAPGVRVVGGSLSALPAEIDAGDNGTAARCLTALAALRSAPTRIDGSARLRQRPMAPLLAALRELGAEFDSEQLPLTIRGPIEGGIVRVDTELSSQFATALVLLVERVKGLKVKVEGKASFAYVGLTAVIMRQFEDPYPVEPDFSSAANHAVAAAVSGGDLVLEGLSMSSPQPDARILPFLNRAGAHVTQESDGVRIRGAERLHGIRANLANCPDLAPLLGVLGASAEGETVITGAPHLVHKESDRIEATVDMIRRLGGEAESRPDGLVVRGGKPLRAAELSSHGDHRIAMAAAVLALRVPGVTVTGSEAVDKSYPGFFDDLASLTESSS